MESQMHRSHGHDYDDPLHPTGKDLAEERGGETRAAMKKVKEKVDKLKDTIKLGHGGSHKDEAETVNASPVVRSGLAEPTVMGTPVLAEDLYTTHSDILDTPVRSFAQWEEEERRGAPPPLSTGYATRLTDLPHGDHHTYGGEVNREQLKGSIGKHTFLEKEEEEERPPPLSTGYESLPRVGEYAYGDEDVNRGRVEGSIGNRGGLEAEIYGAPPPPSTGVYGTRLAETSVPDPSTTVPPANLHSTDDTGGKEVGITGILHSFDKMKVFDKHDTESSKPDRNEHEPKLYTGSHDQFKPEPVEQPPLPLDTIAADPSNPNSSYTQRISSATSAIADKAAAVKDSIVSKLSPSGENKSDVGTILSHKPNTKTSFPTALSHKVADTLSSTLGPVYEKVAEVGSSVTSKMHGPGHDDVARSPKEGKGVTMKEYLVDTFKPGDDDKMLSEKITHALHLGKGNQTTQEGSTTTTYEVEVMRDEGERRLQESGN